MLIWFYLVLLQWIYVILWFKQKTWAHFLTMNTVDLMPFGLCKSIQKPPHFDLAPGIMTVMILLSVCNSILLCILKLSIQCALLALIFLSCYSIHSLHGENFSTPHSAFIIPGLEHWTVSWSSSRSSCLFHLYFLRCR